MTEIHLIVALVALAFTGYTLSGIVMWPLTRRAMRVPGVASSVTRALIGSRSWIALYLGVILSAFIWHWKPGTVYLVLAAFLVIDAWGLLIWWFRWIRTHGKGRL